MDISIRERIEQQEYQTLCARAVKSRESLGRYEPEEPCELRTEFQRDRDRIIHCKAFRRLKHKTQVFLAPESDHYRTRLTHTLEVAQIARTIARALQLNEDLTEAIALAHDLGHTPFGHAGERALDKLNPNGFHHYEQSVRVCRFLEKNCEGLNLTKEVLDGIDRHTTGALPATLEGECVRIADRIAYINHDIDDAIRADIIAESDIARDICEHLGFTKSARINALVSSVIFNSGEHIAMDAKTAEMLDRLHDFLNRSVYTNPKAKSEEIKVDGLIGGIFESVVQHPELLPQEYDPIVKNEGLERAVTDYIASMTDHYAVAVYQKLFVPKSWALDI